MNGLLVAAVMAAMASGSGQEAAPQEPQTPATSVEEVVVEGRRLEETVRAFVDEVAAPPPGRRLARWDREICVGAANLQPAYAQFMIDRIATAAVQVGLTSGEPGCRPDIMVIGSDDADALATRLVADNPQGFRPARSGTDMGEEALEAFVNSDAPVRWWHISLPVSVDTGDPAITLQGEDIATVTVRDASRLRSNVREDLARVVVILDVTRIGRVNFGALSDYVAMVALAQLDPQAETTGYDTVLNLFAQPTLTGMTAWDRDYLTALYAAPRDRLRANQQIRDLIRGMAVPSETD
ncbi:hypothetical protein [Brevundimonas balnearis]|uniref:DUF2927 domain-containing protein n=1 Tax=Brevundimonas balnearis TaxID=1572858 RepID=A0ABV6QY97_9CAUL